MLIGFFVADALYSEWGGFIIKIRMAASFAIKS